MKNLDYFYYYLPSLAARKHAGLSLLTGKEMRKKRKQMKKKKPTFS